VLWQTHRKITETGFATIGAHNDLVGLSLQGSTLQKKTFKVAACGTSSELISVEVDKSAEQICIIFWDNENPAILDANRNICIKSAYIFSLG